MKPEIWSSKILISTNKINWRCVQKFINILATKELTNFQEEHSKRNIRELVTSKTKNVENANEMHLMNIQ